MSKKITIAVDALDRPRSRSLCDLGISQDGEAGCDPDWDHEFIYANKGGFWSYDEERQEWVHCETPLDVFVSGGKGVSDKHERDAEASTAERAEGIIRLLEAFLAARESGSPMYPTARRWLVEELGKALTPQGAAVTPQGRKA